MRTAILVAALAGVSAVPAPQTAQGPPTWAEVDALIKDQKFEEASQKVDRILDSARSRRDEAQWTKALVRTVQLRVALGGYETAVRLLKEQPWPPGLLAQTTLDLFYAQALLRYQEENEVEVYQRERVASSGLVDLKAWTREQIVDEAEKAYRRAWERRTELGKFASSALSDFVKPNDYPANVRGTLRDSVSYLYAGLLADSLLWSPGEHLGVDTLDLAALLASDGRGADAILSEETAHPLAKLAAVLGDLETWHAGRNERSAELEARLERNRRLSEAFREPEDKVTVRKDLEARLPRYRDDPWWAMGMGELAGMWQAEAENVPDGLIRAREAALEAFRAYPASPGGRRASEIVAGIETPEYDTTSMTSDAPDRRSIRIAHRNLSELHFRAYRFDLETRIAAATDADMLPGSADVRRLIETSEPGAQWVTALPPTPDFRSHVTFVKPPMRESGAWVVVASERSDFAESGNRVCAVTLILSDLVVLTRPGPSEIEARIVSGETGRPVAGAEVSLWQFDWSARGHHRVQTATSDAHGLVRFPSPSPPPGLPMRHFIVAKANGQIALDPRSLFMLWQPQRETAEPGGSLVYTDRAIYRPTQKVLWKVVAYRGEPTRGRLEPAVETPIAVMLEDADDEVVATRTAMTNAFGTAAGEFVIPPGRALGGWKVRSSLRGEAYIQVEEYKRPTFEISWEEPATPLRLNQPAMLKGSARYYFGLPVSGGTVRWTIRRVPMFPGWWWRSGGGYGGGARVVAQGASPVKADGAFEASFTPAADERLAARDENLVYRFEAIADVTDEGGETRSESRLFSLGFVAVQGEIRLESGFALEGQSVPVTLLRTDLDGAPRPGTGSWRLLPIAQPARTLLPADLPPDSPSDSPFATPGDRLRPRWETHVPLDETMRGWKDGPERARGDVVHDAKGQADIRLPALPAGAWRLRYETRDAYGKRYETTKDFLVAGKRTRIALPAVLLAEKSSVPPGETARFLVSSGLAGQILYFEILGGGAAKRREMVSDDAGLVEVPVTADDRGGLTVRVSLVRDHQFLTQEASILVPWSDRELAVSFETFRDRLRPGAKETWRVRVKAPPGTPSEQRAAELLAYMYDRSLDAFVQPNPSDVLALYPTRRSDPGLFANLWSVGWAAVFPAPSGSPPEEPFHGDQPVFFGEWPIGGPGLALRKMAATTVAVAAEAPAPVQAGVAGGVAAAWEPSYVGSSAEVTVTGEAPLLDSPAPHLRSDFSETAFWKPQLLTDADGSAVIEFQVPDSVTSWNVWVHAVTRDLKAGSIHRETRSVKDLMVRPYVPRFLREGDRGELKVVVNNASGGEMKGTVTLDVLDTETNRSALAEFGLTAESASRPFAAPGNGAATAVFPLAAPRRVGSYAIVAKAAAGDFADGELRPVPVLPGRMQLSQSRFAALNGGETRTLTFPDMATSDDPSRIDEQLVVSIDAQLFYSVLNALPYLVNYPYECTEQTLNRFVSTGIVSSLFRDYPAVAKMAEEFSKRDTPLEAWAAPDPARRMALEETPWLVEAKGGKEAGRRIEKILDRHVATAERQASLAKLRQSQTSIGAFPWWPGGPPSPYMTLYVMYGFAKAAEFGVDVPKDVVEHGWGYLARYFREEYAKPMAEDRCSPEWLTFLGYVATCYPDPSWMGDALTPSERQAILAFSFKHWREQSPYLKGLLALTLSRSGRAKDARLVWSSVMDSAKTDRDLGTYWAPEDRAWLWYEDTIETQAFALRTLMELDPSDPRRHGLVQWLFLNKKLNQWKSTRATAEVLYSLVWYLKKEGAMSSTEVVEVRAGTESATFDFAPDRYTGRRNELVVPGEKIDPKSDAEISVSKAGKGLAFASATWTFSTEKLPAESHGDLLGVSRSYFRRKPSGSSFVLEPLAEGAALSVGDEVEVQLSVRAKHAAEYVHLRDPRAAGLEPGIATSGYRWDVGIGWYEEIRDSGTNFFFEWLPAGEYTLKYRIRANMAGTFRVGPATVQSMYAPEFNAYSAGATLTIR